MPPLLNSDCNLGSSVIEANGTDVFPTLSAAFGSPDDRGLEYASLLTGGGNGRDSSGPLNHFVGNSDRDARGIGARNNAELMVALLSERTGGVCAESGGVACESQVDPLEGSSGGYTVGGHAVLNGADFKCDIPGVRFDHRDKAWLATWHDGNRHVKRCFSIKKHGFQRAKDLAKSTKIVFLRQSREKRRQQTLNAYAAALLPMCNSQYDELRLSESPLQVHPPPDIVEDDCEGNVDMTVQSDADAHSLGQPILRISEGMPAASPLPLHQQSMWSTAHPTLLRASPALNISPPSTPVADALNELRLSKASFHDKEECDVSSPSNLCGFVETDSVAFEATNLDRGVTDEKPSSGPSVAVSLEAQQQQLARSEIPWWSACERSISLSTGCLQVAPVQPAVSAPLLFKPPVPTGSGVSSRRSNSAEVLREEYWSLLDAMDQVDWDKINIEQAVGLINQIPRVRGVCFDRKGLYWISQWHAKQKKHREWFAVKRFGFRKAWKLAVCVRRDAEKVEEEPTVYPYIPDLEEVMGVTYQRGERGRCWVAYFLDTKPIQNSPEENAAADAVYVKGVNYCVGVRYFPVADQAFEVERQRAVDLVKAHPLPDALFQVFDHDAAERAAAAEALAAEGSGVDVATSLAAATTAVENAATSAGVRYLNTFASMPSSTSHYVQMAKMERRLQLLLSGTSPAVASAVAAAELPKHQSRETALTFRDSGASRTSVKEPCEGVTLRPVSGFGEKGLAEGSSVTGTRGCSGGGRGTSVNNCGGPQASAAMEDEDADALLDDEDLKAAKDLFGIDVGKDLDHPWALRLPKIGGVYYKRDGNYKAWAASWHIKGKRVRRYFTVKKHGFKNAYLQAVRARREAEQQDGICVKQRQHGTHWRVEDLLQDSAKHNVKPGSMLSQRQDEQCAQQPPSQNRSHGPCGSIPRTIAAVGEGRGFPLVAQYLPQECEAPSLDCLGEVDFPLEKKHACLGGRGRTESGSVDVCNGGAGPEIDWSVATPIQRAACALNMRVDDLLVLLLEQQERGTKLPTNVRFAISREALDVVLRDLHRHMCHLTGVNPWTSDGISDLSSEQADALLQLFVVGRVLTCVRRSRSHAEIEGLVKLFDLCFVDGTLPSYLNTQVLRQLLHKLCGTSLSWMSEAEYLPDSLLLSAFKTRSSDRQLSRCVEDEIQAVESRVLSGGLSDGDRGNLRCITVNAHEGRKQQQAVFCEYDRYLDQASGSTADAKSVIREESVYDSSDEQIGEGLEGYVFCKEERQRM